jgi:hypothetical protein
LNGTNRIDFTLLPEERSTVLKQKEDDVKYKTIVPIWAVGM